MDIYKALCDDHRHLDVLFEALLNTIHVNDAVDAEAAWTELDDRLGTHLDAEEADMLPLFDYFDPVEGARIRSDHGRIRSLMAELGVRLGIHALREETVTELVGFLRTHAAREEAQLYPWANRELAERSRQSLLQRLHDRRRGQRRRRAAEETAASAR